MLHARSLIVSLLVLLTSAMPLAAEPPGVGTGPVLTKVRVLPTSGKNELLRNAWITGSITSATNDFVRLAQIKEVPTTGWIEIPVDAKGEVYRFIKIETPPNSYGNVAEIEFYSGERKLTGTGFGTQGSRDDKGNTFDKALDGNPDTFFEGKGHGNEYVGLDLGAEVQVAELTVNPAGGVFEKETSVTLSTSTPGAEIRYRLDGQTPGRDARLYTGPIKIAESSVLHAVAYKPGMARSLSLVAPYRIGKIVSTGEYATFHIGNSLTDTLDGWLQPLMQSAGYKHRFHRFTIPGAPTDWLWDHPGSGFGDTQFREAFLVRAPLTDVFTQPFEGHNRSIANEAEHSSLFFAEARKHSPEVQPWLYSQWPKLDAKGNWSDATGSNKGLPGVAPVNGDWTVAAENHLRYFEAVRERIQQTWDGKPVRIVPTARAMAAAKKAIAAGQVPGVTSFDEFFSDGLHLSPKGRWFVANVVAACITGQSTEGKALPLNSGLTPDGAAALQKIAWDVVSGYEFAMPKK